jgi:hypothetical protein
MNSPFVVWRTRLKSACNAVLSDTRLLTGVVFMLAFNVGLSVWSLGQLPGLIQHWRSAGDLTLTTGLWQLCLWTWWGISIFTLLNILQMGLRNEELLLLLTMPIKPAALFRTVYGFLILDLWNWLLLSAIIVGIALVTTLGWPALLWLLVLYVGSGLVIFLVQVVALLAIHSLLTREQLKLRVGATLAFVLLIIAALLVFHTASVHVLLVILQPAFMLPLLILTLIIALGPLAGPWGKFCVMTLIVREGHNRLRRAWTLPGILALQYRVQRSRTFEGALVSRALLSQSRNWIFWLRMVALLIWLPLSALVHPLAARFLISDTLFVAGYTTLLTVVLVLETAPNALSGEGSRFSLYLVAPLECLRILRAKLLLFLFPLLLIDLIMGLVLSWQLRLTAVQTGFALLAATLMTSVLVNLLVLGSVWDLDLNLQIEGIEQILLQEEGPFSPRRMALVNLCVLLLGLMLLLLWKLPPLPALTLLFLLTALVSTSMWHWGNKHLDHLLRSPLERDL